MTTSGAENGSSNEELAQRVARLEGAMGHRREHRPWWLCWVMVWLVFSAVRSFGWHCGDGRFWGMAWPMGVLLVCAVMYFVRERRDASFHGGNR
jgi:hypothetical protein